MLIIPLYMCFLGKGRDEPQMIVLEDIHLNPLLVDCVCFKTRKKEKRVDWKTAEIGLDSSVTALVDRAG